MSVVQVRINSPSTFSMATSPMVFLNSSSCSAQRERERETDSEKRKVFFLFEATPLTQVKLIRIGDQRSNK